jgi:membrane protein
VSVTLKRLTSALRAAGAHDASGRAAQVAFYGLLAIFPGILALLGLLPLLNLQQQLDTLQDLTRRGLPPRIADLILSEVSGLDERHGWALVATLLIALYNGSNALGAMLSGVGLAFGKPQAHPLRTALVGAGLTGLLLIGIPVALALLMFASWLLSWVATFGVLGAGLDRLVSGFRWPLLWVGFQQVALGLYRVGAGKRLHYTLISPGSVFAAVAWAVCTAGFEWFVQVFSNLGATYGSLAAVIALMLYVNTIASVVLLGAEIDAAARAPAPQR